jgi:hypothetical protein
VDLYNAVGEWLRAAESYKVLRTVEEEAGPAYLGLAPKVPTRAPSTVNLFRGTYTINDTFDTGFELSVLTSSPLAKREKRQSGRFTPIFSPTLDIIQS